MVPGASLPWLLTAVSRTSSPVQVIEEGEQVEGEFAPGLLLAVVEDVSIHDGDRIIHDLGAIRGTMEVPGVGEGPERPPSKLPPPSCPCFSISLPHPQGGFQRW